MLDKSSFIKKGITAMLAGGLIIGVFQPISGAAAKSIQALDTAQTTSAQKSVNVILNGKPLTNVKAIHKENTVWVPILAFSKSAGMTIHYSNEDGWKEWEISFKPHSITSQVNRFYLNVEEGDIYLMTEGGAFFENLRVIKGVVYAPANILSTLMDYNTTYDNKNQKIQFKSIDKSQDQAIKKLAFAYLKEYEHVDKMNKKLYHPNYLQWQYSEKYPTFLSSIQPGKYDNPKDSKVIVSDIILNSLVYNMKANNAKLELEYKISNNMMPIHYHVNSSVLLKKVNGNWVVEAIIDGYSAQINDNILNNQSKMKKENFDLIAQIQQNAMEYYTSWVNKNAEALVDWTDLSNNYDENGRLYTKEELIQDFQEYFDVSESKSELEKIDILNIKGDTSLILSTIKSYDNAQFNGGEPDVQKKLSQFKKTQENKWKFEKDIDFIDMQMSEVSGYAPALIEE